MGYQYLADFSGNPRTDGIQRTGDPGTTMPTWVSKDPDGTDWKAFQAWLAAGNTPAGPVYSAPVPTVTGNQWAFALSDMGLSSAWRIGVTKSKDSDQVRVGLIARDTPLVASDPLLIRVAANAGLDASGNALVSVPAVFGHAQGMPT